MRKLWSSTVPGKDRSADIIFHFHQELPKLLRGYHQCTKEEAAILGALIYRVKYAETKADISSCLKSLIPSDLAKIMSSHEWKKEIARAYNKDSGMSPDEAKIAFLKVIYRWPTYGSAFFEVNQVSDPSFPEHLIVAINKQGVNMIHAQSKVRPSHAGKLSFNIRLKFNDSPLHCCALGSTAWFHARRGNSDLLEIFPGVQSQYLQQIVINKYRQLEAETHDKGKVGHLV